MSIDLEKLGLMEEEVQPEQDSEEQDPIRIIMDSLLVSLQQRDEQIAILSKRITLAERGIQYLLMQDQTILAKMQAEVAQENQTDEKTQ